MVNLTPRQIILIGAAIVFGPPLLLGILLGHFVGWFTGIGAGIILFLVIVAIASVEIRKRLEQHKDSQNDDKQE